MRFKSRPNMLMTALIIVAASGFLFAVLGNGSSEIVYNADVPNWHWSGASLTDQYFALLLDESDLPLVRAALPDQVWKDSGPSLQEWLARDDTAVVMAYLGKARTGGYAIRVRNVRVDHSPVPSVTVTIARRRPGAGEFVTQAFTYPYEMVPISRDKLPETPFAVRFVDDDGRLIAGVPQRLIKGGPFARLPVLKRVGHLSADDVSAAFQLVPGELHVTGHAEVVTSPEKALVALTVIGRADAPHQARQAMDEQLRDVLAALERFGLERHAMHTQHVSLQAVRYAGSSPPPMGGYEARVGIEVRLDDLERLGELVQTVVDAGVQQVDGVEFALKDERAWLERALRDAVADAQWRADTIADALGQTIVGIAEVRDESAHVVPPTSFATGSAADADTVVTGLPPIELRVRARVTVIYRVMGQPQG